MLACLPKFLRMRFFSVTHVGVGRCPLPAGVGLKKSRARSHRSTKTAPRRPRLSTVANRAGRGRRRGRRMEALLDLHLRAGVLELLLHRFGIGLGNGFLDRRGCALDQVLGFLEPEAGELADHLDHGHFLVGGVLLQSDGEFRLLLGRRACCRAGARACGDGDRGCGGDAELLLHVGDQFDDLHEGHLGDCIEDFVFIDSHVSLLNLFADGQASAAGFWSRTAARVRASLASGSASVRTSFSIGAFSTPSSIDSACSRVGRLATRSSSRADSTCPPRATSVAMSLSFALAKSFTTRAAAPGSSFEKASTSGPLSFGPTASNDVPASALRASVFLTTRMYTPCFLALARSSVICPTVSPRSSAATTDWAFAATSATSATSAFLSSR